MAVATPRQLSGSTNGRGILIQSTNAASGTLLHTSATQAGAAQFDEGYIYLMNLTTVVKKIVLNWGGTTSGDKLRLTVPSSSGGMYLATPGFRLNGGVTVRAYATGAAVVAAFGYINRYV